MITVYSLPNCGRCTATKRALTSRGIPFREVDMSQDEAAGARVRAWGYREAPVVEV